MLSVTFTQKIKCKGEFKQLVTTHPKVVKLFLLANYSSNFDVASSKLSDRLCKFVAT